jgi:hypothetical protein
MAEWLEDHMVAICPLKLNSVLLVRLWLNWRPGWHLGGKGRTVGWEGRGVVCGKLAPSRM